MTETSSSQDISTKLERIAKLAREIRGATLKTLAHHIDVNWLREAYRRTRKDGAPGVDGVSAEQYAEHLEDNLQSLLDRAKSGRYRAPPVRRVHIPKGDGMETRPIGIGRGSFGAVRTGSNSDQLRCGLGSVEHVRSSNCAGSLPSFLGENLARRVASCRWRRHSTISSCRLGVLADRIRDPSHENHKTVCCRKRSALGGDWRQCPASRSLSSQ
jgi:hypothetical protein